jgi:hypothetical protein
MASQKLQQTEYSIINLLLALSLLLMILLIPSLGNNRLFLTGGDTYLFLLLDGFVIYFLSEFFFSAIIATKNLLRQQTLLIK